jgi:ribose/xylose/arabinose/galactoside ABC-type transport system permease subunit
MSGGLSFNIGRSWRRESLAVLDRLGVWAALALLIAAASVLSPYFFSMNNFLNILNQSSVVGVTAVGVTLVMITGGVDLSVGSVISLSADICATVMNGNDARIVLAVALGIGAGAAVGFVNGILVAKRNLPSFILTLGTAAAVQGLGLLYTGGTASGVIAPWFQSMIGGRPWGHIPGVVLIFAAVAAIGLLIQETTALGSRLYLVGSNIRAAYLSGIAVDRVLILAYTLSGAAAGIAGVVLLGRVGVSSAFAGQTYTFDALAAVLLGGTTFQGGRGGIVGTLAGVLILVVAFNLVNILGLNFNLQLVVKGVIIISAAALYRLLNRAG